MLGWDAYLQASKYYCMKNFSIVLNLVLLVAVGVLFYFQFKSPKTAGQVQRVVSDTASPGSFKIVYFEMDSLDVKYEYLKEVREVLRRKEAQMGNEMKQMEIRLTNKYKEYQQRAASMSQAEQMALQQELSQMQQDAQAAGQEKSQELNGESMRRLQEVKLKIQDFLKAYSAQHGYVFVYAADRSDNIYYKDPSRDITAEVIRLLNEQYHAEKKKK
ncbi:OmpH family outer membrane protein [Filimonas effusa]|uniref:OmpH family outer membrane protein n=2 Tax=Filimonas effusa TaxID=2508721 RepID=A0A4Q1CYY6_9BACT|nr:OmpH family outer membrane protein [Filimonas effusa]